MADKPRPQDTRPGTSASARQAKIQAAAKARGTGPSRVTIAGVIAIIALIAVIAWVIIADQQAKDKATTGGASLPPGVAAMGDPISRGTPKSGAPVLDIYEDFQCPGCEVLERSLGSTIRELAADGSVDVRYYMMTFLDGRFPGDHSNRAANAAVCAVAAGKFGELHDLVYANQPTTEGAGWTDAQLTDWARQAGITGTALTTWETCFKDKSHNQYVNSIEDASAKAGVTATPTLKLNGKVLDMSTVKDAAGFRAKVLAG